MIKILTVVLSTDPGASSQWVAGGAALALLSVSIGVIFKLLLNQSQENKICNWRLGTLYNALIDSNIKVPQDFLNGPPNLSERRRRKVSMSINKDESGQIDRMWLATAALMMIFLVGFGSIFYIFVIHPISVLQDNQQESSISDRQDKCVASLTADEFVAIIYQLKSTPDSSSRDFYSDLAVKAATRIRNRGDICDDGIPDKFEIPETAP